MTINNVNIGDKFKIYPSSTKIAEVVDFYEIKSLTTNEVVGYKCMVRGVDTLATNVHEVPFATVVRNRIINK
jgi:hypothetical protein